MIHRDELISIISNYFGIELLKEAREHDKKLANGIQILGKESVQTVVVGVSATMELFNKAKKLHADVVLAKHPIQISPPFQLLSPSLQQRLRIIFTQNWTVGGYHYVLDIHPVVGNAPLLLKALGAKVDQRFFNKKGYTAHVPSGTTYDQIAKKLEKIVHHTVFSVIPPNKKHVKKIGVVTGSAIPHEQDVIEMLELGVDLYITGEITEWGTHLFSESGIGYFAAGHHATEVLGPKKFAQVLRKLVGNRAKVTFIDVWNEI